ncbi:histidine phosphatase family protein [Pseudonocardia nantongensis]|uniref:histidine phosphatase family protein n=1 Tax=Pseudonocardia nantongensis TaxID=1181885 RepID=UPI00397CA6D2
MTPEQPAAGRIFLVRHGETEWSAAGKHTGRSDIPLTDTGRAAARRVRAALSTLRGNTRPARVLCSPRTRARDTAALAGLRVDAVDDRLAEWDYGAQEGLTTPQIRESLPGWTVWDGPWPGGETPDAVSARADAVLADARAWLAGADAGSACAPPGADAGSACAPPGADAGSACAPPGIDAGSACAPPGADVVLVGHGHFSRVLAVRWIGLPATGGVHVRMDPAGVTVLGTERGVPRLDHVNHRPPAPESE